jgi:hypothetical protein
MANEFSHQTVGADLTQAEYESILGHSFSGQATGDIMYASSATQLSRLPIGTAGYPLVAGASPVWGGAMTLNGTLTIGGQFFDAGSGDCDIRTTADWRGLYLRKTGDTAAGFRIKVHCESASPAASDTLVSMMGTGKNDAAATSEYGDFRIMIEDETAAGGHSGKMEWHNFLNGGDNTAMTLSAAGGLGVDADISTGDDPVALFDDYDDALMLKQGIQEQNHDLLVEMGIFSRKSDGSGYMMNIQPMTRLLAGGIYQNRAMIENVIELFTGEIGRLEQQLAVLNGGSE